MRTDERTDPLAEFVVALDVPSRAGALELVDRLGDAADFYKVGLELFGRAGPPVVGDLRQRGKRVFLDLKLHDIPNTVRGAVEAAVGDGVEMLTVHAAGGPSMLEAAAEAAGGGARLLGVTVLTSFSASDVEAVWGRDILSVRDEVVRLAALVRDAGLDGVVASALEVEVVKRQFGREFLVATPGIRLSGDPSDDQARVATPAEAVRAGADYLVVGRSVTAAADPVAALDRMRDEAAVDAAVGEEWS